MKLVAQVSAVFLVLAGMVSGMIYFGNKMSDRYTASYISGCAEFAELYGVETRYNPAIGCQADAGDGNWIPVVTW